MAWIELHQTLVDHPKVRRLARALGVHPMQAIGHLVALWLWCLDYAPAGDLGHVADDDLADAARWSGDAGRFVAELERVMLVDYVAGSRAVHDWEDYAGRLMTKRTQHAAKMRELRAGRREAPDRPQPADSSPKPTRSRPVPLVEPSYPSEFERWWAGYRCPPDRKRPKAKCLEKWDAYVDAGVLEADIIAGTAAWFIEWDKDAGKFAPGPLVFLNQALWRDAPTGATAAARPFASKPWGADWYAVMGDAEPTQARVMSFAARVGADATGTWEVYQEGGAEAAGEWAWPL